MANEGINTITYTPADGVCETTATLDIVINPLPVVDFNVNSVGGCVPFTTTYTDLTNPAGSSLEWSFGNGDQSTQNGTVAAQYATPGLYDVSLTATSPAGCVNSITKLDAVEAFANADASFSVSTETIGMSTPEVEFYNNSDEADEFTWTFGDGNTSMEDNPTHKYNSFDQNPTVTLIANNEGGCSDTMSYTLTIVEDLLYFIPNTFTPDGDKFNNEFVPVFSSGYDATTYSLEIYNRWGELMFQSFDPNIGWDGTYQNNLCQSGTYIWKVSFKLSQNDSKVSDTGTLNLLR